MSKFLGVLSIIVVILLAMGFAAANAGYRVTLDLGLFTLYRVPVTLVAFSGLFVGMVLMFITGVHTDLKVRRILRDRFAEESRQERTAIDRNQQDLFGADTDSDGDRIGGGDPDPEGQLGEENPTEVVKESGLNDTGTPPAEAETPPAEAKRPPAEAKTPPAEAKTPPAEAEEASEQQPIE